MITQISYIPAKIAIKMMGGNRIVWISTNDQGPIMTQGHIKITNLNNNSNETPECRTNGAREKDLFIPIRTKSTIKLPDRKLESSLVYAVSEFL